MTDSKYNDPDFLNPKILKQKKSKTPVIDAAAYHVTKLEGPTGDITEEVVPALIAREFECQNKVASIPTEVIHEDLQIISNQLRQVIGLLGIVKNLIFHNSC